MPISIDEFESENANERRTNAERVLRFLVHNREKAYKATEIADATGVNPNSIHSVLRRLADQNLVRHREPYWAAGDLDSIRDASIFSSMSTFLDDELGTESREEWLDASRDEDAEE
jgi:sugar-specific transcriptional regulator TrmB